MGVGKDRDASVVLAVSDSLVPFIRIAVVVFFNAIGGFPLHSQGAAHKGIAAMITADIHGETVCGGASDGSCTVWNLRTCREQARLTGHQQKVG